MHQVRVIYNYSPRPYYFKTRGPYTAEALALDFQNLLHDEIKSLCLYRGDRLIRIFI